MSRRVWSYQEDQAIIALIQKNGNKNWSLIAEELAKNYKFKMRTGKQCRQRYHNHLDPKICKQKWTEEEQVTLFKLHKIYGNKWTSIAEHIKGRTDNTIKNHFYSTIRRSLRRMGKHIGSKNSTQQMKEIKPSTLSKIFSINTKPSSMEQQNQQNQKRSESKMYDELINFLTEECVDLTDSILEFSTFKPKGKNNKISEEDKIRFQQVLKKMTKLNELYEAMRKEQRKLNPKMDLEDSGSQNLESQQSQEIQHVQKTKMTRSKRQVKPPQKFNHQLINPSRKAKQLIVLKKNSQLGKQLKQNENLLHYQKQELYNFQQNQRNNVDYNIDVLNKEPEFEINFKQKQEDMVFPQFQIGQTPLAYTPNYFFNTPALQFHSPKGAISANSNGSNSLFSHINNNWNVKAGQLDDIANILGSQIAKNSETSQNAIAGGQTKEDGRTSSSSNINCSPHSAFRSCQ